MKDRHAYRIYNEDKKIIQHIVTKPRDLKNEFYMQIDCTGVHCCDEDGSITNYKLMQCTGQYDDYDIKKELLYEGDIIEIGGHLNGDTWIERHIDKIIWDDECTGFRTDKECIEIKPLKYRDYIILKRGNIYENPELLTEE